MSLTSYPTRIQIISNHAEIPDSLYKTFSSKLVEKFDDDVNLCHILELKKKYD